MEIISQQEAHERGLLRYYTGKACRAGHVSERYVRNGSCIRCQKKYSKFAPNPYTRTLQPWAPQMMYAPEGLTPEQAIAAQDYLRRCLIHWVAENGLMTPERQDAYDQREMFIAQRRSKGEVHT